MIIINNREIRDTVEQVHENKDNIEYLQGKHIYEHLLFVSGKLKDMGVTKDDFTFALRCRILNNSPTKITAETLASTIGQGGIPAGGVAHYTSHEYQYTIYELRVSILDKTVLEIATVTIDYTPAGLSSSVIGEFTNVIDKVNTLL